MRAAVERIDAIRVLETDPAQHVLDAFGLRADLTDDVLRVTREERDVDRVAREKIAHEVLVLAREQIRLAITHVREVTSDGFPEVTRSVRLEWGEQLGEELVAKERAVRRDEQKAHVRDEQPESLWRLAVLGGHDESTDLGRAVVGKPIPEERLVKVLVDARRVFLFTEHVEVDVGRTAPSELGDDHRRARGGFRFQVPQHEHVLAKFRGHVPAKLFAECTSNRRTCCPIVGQFTVFRFRASPSSGSSSSGVAPRISYLVIGFSF